MPEIIMKVITAQAFVMTLMMVSGMCCWFPQASCKGRGNHCLKLYAMHTVTVRRMHNLHFW